MSIDFCRVEDQVVERLAHLIGVKALLLQGRLKDDC